MLTKTQLRLLARSKVSVAGCWLWQGYLSPLGYGSTDIHKERTSAHRACYREFVGPIPEGLELDHLCRIRHCVNPWHLEPVTHLVNVRRGSKATKTLCKHGHSLSGNNLYVDPNGHRECRVCICARAKRYGQRKRELIRIVP